MVSNKNSYFTMVCRGIPRLNLHRLQWYYICDIILFASSMIIQLQKLWIFYYIPSHYNSFLFRSLHYCRPGLIIWLEKTLW